MPYFENFVPGKKCEICKVTYNGTRTSKYCKKCREVVKKKRQKGYDENRPR